MPKKKTTDGERDAALERLWQAWFAHREMAVLDELVEAYADNARYAARWAFRRLGERRETIDEQESVGLCALPRIIAAYEPDKGKWRTYFVGCMRREVWRHIRDESRGWRVNPPKVVSLAAAFHVAARGEPVDAQEMARDEASKALAALTPRLALAVRLCVMEGRTLDEAGKVMNISRARVQQLRDKALRLMRQRFSSESTP